MSQADDWITTYRLQIQIMAPILSSPSPEHTNVAFVKNCLNHVTLFMWEGAERNPTIRVSLKPVCFKHIQVWIYLYHRDIRKWYVVINAIYAVAKQPSLETCMSPPPNKHRFPHLLFSCFLIWTWKKHYVLFPHKTQCCDKPLNHYDGNTEQQPKEKKKFLLSSYYILASEWQSKCLDTLKKVKKTRQTRLLAKIMML